MAASATSGARGGLLCSEFHRVACRIDTRIIAEAGIPCLVRELESATEVDFAMKKTYVVFEGFLGGASSEISEADYEKAKRLREVVVSAFNIEETFSLAALSYLDFEKMLLSASLEWSLEDADFASHNDYFDHWREVINLKLLSLLTSGGVYTEKMERLAKSADIPGFNWDAYDPGRKEVFDSDLCYRVMCALRNFSIHDKLPISGFSVGFKNEAPSGRLNDGEPWRQRISCSPHIRIEPLLGSEKIRKKTRDEIEKLDATGIDLKFFVRGYIESLFKLHQLVRNLTKESLGEALRELSSIEKFLSDVKGENCNFAHIGEKGAGMESALHIDTARLSRIQGKRQSWGKLKGIRRRYISSETTQRKGVSLGVTDDIWIQT
jgi:hypothetical protein